MGFWSIDPPFDRHICADIWPFKRQEVWIEQQTDAFEHCICEKKKEKKRRLIFWVGRPIIFFFVTSYGADWRFVIFGCEAIEFYSFFFFVRSRWVPGVRGLLKRRLDFFLGR